MSVSFGAFGPVGGWPFLEIDSVYCLGRAQFPTAVLVFSIGGTFMIVGVPRESFPGERRVALVPAAVPNLTKTGFQVVVEAEAGARAGYPDADYAAKGAKIVSDRAEVFRAADIVLQVLCYGSNDRTGKADVALFRSGQALIGFLRPLGSIETIREIAAKEQVQSLGGRFVELPLEAKDAEDARGYARAQDEAFYKRQRELLGKVVVESDVVISAAVIPGKKPPILVTKEMVAGMAPGSVIVDLAGERGGNCELTRPGEIVVQYGVTIIGWFNLASTVPYHASQMYARNVSAFLLHLVKDGKLRLNTDDEIVRETMLTQDGEVVNPRIREFFSLPALPGASKGVTKS